MPRKDWIQTLTGKMLIPTALTPEMVGPIEEIAHSLAHEYRFTRQTKDPYSVAEHCVRGSFLLPPAFAGAFLLHELSEVYLPDIAGPLKPSLRVMLDPDDATNVSSMTWAELERQHTHAILEALNLSSLAGLIYSDEVKHMDLAMLAAEKRDLCGPEPESWGLPHPPANTGTIVPWTSATADVQFLSRFHQLFHIDERAARSALDVATCRPAPRR